MGKEKKKKLVAFHISHESGVKNFLNLFINNYPKGTH